MTMSELITMAQEADRLYVELYNLWAEQSGLTFAHSPGQLTGFKTPEAVQLHLEQCARDVATLRRYLSATERGQPPNITASVYVTCENLLKNIRLDVRGVKA